MNDLSSERSTSTNDDLGLVKSLGQHALALFVFAIISSVMIFGIGAGAYLWIKALHVIAVIAWMAGLLYLPRLLIYHTEAGVGSVEGETFKIMERRLLKAIMTPAMIVSTLTGLWMAIVIHSFSGGWLHVKLAILVVLFAVHGHLAASVRRFAGDDLRHTSRYWRIMNEVPTLAMIAIVILVIVQPF